MHTKGLFESESWFRQTRSILRTRWARIRRTRLICFAFIFVSLIVIIRHPSYLENIQHGLIDISLSDTITNDDSDIDLYPSKRPKCEKSITFIFSGCCGFASEVISLLNVMIFANDTGRPLFLRQRDWNYGAWGDYFVDFPVPECRIPPSKTKIGFPHAFHPEELIIEEQKFLNGDHLYINRYGVHMIDRHMINKYGKRTSGAGFDWEYASKAQERTLETIWKPNRAIYELILSQMKLNSEEKTTGSVIGVQIRRGDKAREIEAFSKDKNYLDYYVHAISDIVDKRTSVQPKAVWVMSDDHEAISNLTEISNDWNIRPVLESTYEMQIKPHYQWEFNHLSRRQRITRGQTLVAELSMLVQADYLVLTLSSNVGRLLFLLRGWDRRDTIKSLDGEFFPTVFLPHLVDSQNPHAKWVEHLQGENK